MSKARSVVAVGSEPPSVAIHSPSAVRKARRPTASMSGPVSHQGVLTAPVGHGRLTDHDIHSGSQQLLRANLPSQQGTADEHSAIADHLLRFDRTRLRYRDWSRRVRVEQGSRSTVKVLLA
jgi:hypothetical protein